MNILKKLHLLVWFGTLIFLGKLYATYNNRPTYLRSNLSTEEIIDGVMNYDMHYMIVRCQKDNNYTNDDMVLLERELKRYLLLCILHKDDDLGSGMYSTDVDNLWHTFILFTPAYTKFGEQFNGHYIHHVPETDEKRGEDPEKVATMRQDFQAFITNYETAFGEEIHPIWLLDACEDIENIQKN